VLFIQEMDTPSKGFEALGGCILLFKR
jgi:hypothetical protein